MVYMVSKNSFHEHWYRIRELSLALSEIACISTQRYHGVRWYIISNDIQNKYYRVNKNTYNFITQLDGKRTVDEIWHQLIAADPHNAPVQGEVIQVLTQLFAAGLLRGNITPDTDSLLRSIEKNEWQARKAFWGSIFFPRLPLFDPDRMLEFFMPLARIFVSWFGVLFWVLLIVLAVWNLAGNIQSLSLESQSVLALSNLPLLYLGLAFTKLLHEAGHAFTCKIFGSNEGENTEVHIFGIMILVFSPLPYVDVSSAWKLKKKSDRIFVGLGGIMVELAVAAVAAVVWCWVYPGSIIHQLAYNIMFTCGVSTVVFNANPLLRYDGYYVLCDLLEIPNLSFRANTCLVNLLKRIFFRIKPEEREVYTTFEKYFFPIYSIAAFGYRLVVFAGISMFVASQLFIIGVMVAVSGAIGIIVRPLFKYGRYLVSSHELMYRRKFALLLNLILLLFLVLTLGLVPFKDYERIEGVIEPVTSHSVRAGSSGVIREFIAPGNVGAGQRLISLVNQEFRVNLERAQAQYDVGEYQIRQALLQSPVAYQIASEQQTALEEQINTARSNLDNLQISSAYAGRWFPESKYTVEGVFINKGEKAGLLLGEDGLQIRCVATQNTSAAIVNEGSRQVEIRLRESPEILLRGKVLMISPAGSKELPSYALSDLAGGEVQTTLSSTNRRESKERLFVVIIRLDEDSLKKQIFSGQTVVARIKISDSSLLRQIWNKTLQLLQKKYQI